MAERQRMEDGAERTLAEMFEEARKKAPWCDGMTAGEQVAGAAAERARGAAKVRFARDFHRALQDRLGGARPIGAPVDIVGTPPAAQKLVLRAAARCPKSRV